MDAVTFKVVVAGAFASGKTTLIQSVSDTSFVGTEVPTSGPEATVKSTTTVGMEFGTHTVGEGADAVSLALYGVPGQERFRFMWDIVADGMDGLLVLVDATAPETWAEAVAITAHMRRNGPVPTVVGVGRTGGDWSVVDAVQRDLGVVGATYVPCDAPDPASANAAVIEVLFQVLAALRHPVP